MTTNIASIILLRDYLNEENYVAILHNEPSLEDIKLLRKLKKYPVIILENEIRQLVKLYPIELNYIKFLGELIQGKDVLNNIKLKKQDLKDQLYRDLKSKIIDLRTKLTTKNRLLRELIINIPVALEPIGYAICKLYNYKIPREENVYLYLQKKGFIMNSLLDPFKKGSEYDRALLIIEQLNNLLVTLDSK